MSVRDCYEVLGVARDATPEEIKKAYRRLSRKHHPDRDGGDAEAMSEINCAYAVLSDPEKRKQYDETGHAQGPRMTLEQKALTVLMQLFATVMANVPDSMIGSVDLFGETRRQLDGNLKKKLEEKHKLERSIAMVEKIRKRVRARKGAAHGGRLFDQVFDANIRNSRNALADIEETVVIAKMAYDLLKGYEMECESGGTPRGPINPFGGKSALLDALMRGAAT